MLLNGAVCRISGSVLFHECGSNRVTKVSNNGRIVKNLSKFQKKAMGGFSLLEVLVSIVVLSFGLLGMVGLQAAAIQSNREARLQSTAISLARELAEMMRGNKNVAIDAGNPYLGDFTSPLAPATASYCLSVSSAITPTSNPVCTTGIAIANAQMTEWLARVDSELPGAHVKICADAAPFETTGSNTGLPRWDCSATSAATTILKIGWTQGSTNRANTNTAPLDRATRPSIVFPITPGTEK